MKNPIANLQKVFESRIRLGIMSALMVNDTLDFNALKELLETDRRKPGQPLESPRTTGNHCGFEAVCWPETQYHLSGDGAGQGFVSPAFDGTRTVNWQSIIFLITNFEIQSTFNNF